MKRAKSSKIIPTLILISFILLGYYSYHYATTSPYLVSSAQAKELIKNKQIDVVLDVRTNLERSTLGFYPGSVHIQSTDLAKQMAVQVPDKNARILAYCNSGHRAKLATNKLQELGYKNTVYITTPYTFLM